MKVLFIDIGPGGKQSILLNTIKCIKYHYDGDINISALILKDVENNSNTVTELNKLSVDVSWISSDYIVKKFLKANNIVKNKNPDVIHCHHPLSNIVGKITGGLSKEPVVVTTRRNSARGLSKKAVYAEKSTDILSDIKLNVSCGVQNSFNSYTHVYREGHLQQGKRNIVIPNFIDIKVQDDAKKNNKYEIEQKFGSSSFVIGSLGRFTKQKAFVDLINMFNFKLPHNTKIVIAGTGPTKNKIEKMIRARGLDEHVELCGHIRSSATFFDTIDLFILPSLWEGMSKALMEAMYSGTPCIATKIEGNNELIKHDYNGILVTPNSPDILAAEIRKLYREKNKRIAMGNNASKTIKNNYSVQHAGKIYATLYHEINDVFVD